MKTPDRVLTEMQARTMEALVRLGVPATPEDLPYAGSAATLWTLAQRGLINLTISVTRRGYMVMDARAQRLNLMDQHRRRAAKRLETPKEKPHAKHPRNRPGLRSRR